jgi:hypothetical protein
MVVDLGYPNFRTAVLVGEVVGAEVVEVVEVGAQKVGYLS